MVFWPYFNREPLKQIHPCYTLYEYTSKALQNMNNFGFYSQTSAVSFATEPAIMCGNIRRTTEKKEIRIALSSILNCDA
jgi:hypothetical protein